MHTLLLFTCRPSGWGGTFKTLKMEFKQDEIVLVSHDRLQWSLAFYCFPQDDVHRVAFTKTNSGKVGHLECFKYVKKIVL